MHTFQFETIAVIRNPYSEKFSVPRQPGLSPGTFSYIEFEAKYNNADYIRELEQFSHIWLIFVFHQHIDKPVNATVRPPRLGGNERIGVFASRSPFRPNPIGLSVVKLEAIEHEDGKLRLKVSGADLVNGTPIIDIKPYIKYADALPDAVSGYASHSPRERLNVSFSDTAKTQLQDNLSSYPDLEIVITENLALDPRPAYANDVDRVYGVTLYDLNINWKVKDNTLMVLAIEHL